MKKLIYASALLLSASLFQNLNAGCQTVWYKDGSAVQYCETFTIIYSSKTAIGGCAGANTDCSQIVEYLEGEIIA